MSGAGIFSPAGFGDEMIEKPAGPRRIVAGEDFRALRHQPPERAQKLGAAFKSGRADFDR